MFRASPVDLVDSAVSEGLGHERQDIALVDLMAADFDAPQA
jgi:hypothetical protein